MNSTNYFGPTCPTVDRIFDALANSLKDYIYHKFDPAYDECYKLLNEKIETLIEETCYDIKDQVTLPWREVFDKACSQFALTTERLEEEIALLENEISKLDRELDETRQDLKEARGMTAAA